MIYDSPEVIPAKLYFKILETKNLELLTDEKDVDISVLQAAWDKLEESYSSFNKHSSNQQKKTTDIYKKIEAFSSHIKFVDLAVFHLRYIKDDDLIEKLKSCGYKFKWQKTDLENHETESVFQNDLDQIEREVKAFELKIKIEQNKLPKPKEGDNEKDEVPFDETVLMYAAFTGLGYIDPNKLPLTQYDAIIVNGNKKMKALEKPINNGKK